MLPWALIKKEKTLPGFGEIFRMLSYEQVGAAAILSRATAGIYQGKLIVSTPGSPAAVQLAWEKLILPELQHLAWENENGLLFSPRLCSGNEPAAGRRDRRIAPNCSKISLTKNETGVEPVSNDSTSSTLVAPLPNSTGI